MAVAAQAQEHLQVPEALPWPCLDTGFNPLPYLLPVVIPSLPFLPVIHVTRELGVFPSSHYWLLNVTVTLGLLKYSLILFSSISGVSGVSRMCPLKLWPSGRGCCRDTDGITKGSDTP